VAGFLVDRRGDVHDAARSSPFSYASRRLRETVLELVADVGLPGQARVLDYGCGVAPYREDLPPGARYVGADIPGNPSADVEIRADGTVPVPDGEQDLVLSSQVLEHVEDTDTYLAECRRVLRPGGSLVLTTHGIMYYHRDPEDYWRWTRAGLESLLRRHRFDIASVRGVIGLAPAAVQLFQDATLWKVPGPLRRPYTFAMQSAMGALDRRYSDELRSENSLILAVRAVRAAPS